MPTSSFLVGPVWLVGGGGGGDGGHRGHIAVPALGGLEAKPALSTLRSVQTLAGVEER